MQTYRIAVVAGDGIGPEVVASGIAIMDASAALSGEFVLEYAPAPAGAGCYLDCGEDLPASSLAVCHGADAILLGACGLPDVRRPDGTELTPQITLRRASISMPESVPPEASRVLPARYPARGRSTW